jgi:hypothetical protein
MTARCVACHRRRTHVRPPAAPTTRFARSCWRAPLPCCPFVGFVLADNPDGFHLIALPGGLALRMAALLDCAYPRAAEPGGLVIGPFNRSIEEKLRVQDLVRDNKCRPSPQGAMAFRKSAVIPGQSAPTPELRSMACCSKRVARRIKPNTRLGQISLFRQINVRKDDGQRRQEN